MSAGTNNNLYLWIVKQIRLKCVIKEKIFNKKWPNKSHCTIHTETISNLPSSRHRRPRRTPALRRPLRRGHPLRRPQHGHLQRGVVDRQGGGRGAAGNGLSEVGQLGTTWSPWYQSLALSPYLLRKQGYFFSSPLASELTP